MVGNGVRRGCPKLPQLVPVTDTRQQKTPMTGTRAHEKPSLCHVLPHSVPVTDTRQQKASVTGTKTQPLIGSLSSFSVHKPSPESANLLRRRHLCSSHDSSSSPKLLRLLSAPINQRSSNRISLSIQARNPRETCNEILSALCFSFKLVTSPPFFTVVSSTEACFSTNSSPRFPFYSVQINPLHQALVSAPLLPSPPSFFFSPDPRDHPPFFFSGAVTPEIPNRGRESHQREGPVSDPIAIYDPTRNPRPDPRLDP